MLTSNDIAKIYDHNFEKIYRFFYYKFNSKDLAEDLTSETFMQFITQVKQKADSVEQPEHYLYGIAKNVYLTTLKKKYRQIPTVSIENEQEFGDCVESFVDIIDDSPTIEDLANKLIVLLPEKQQDIARMRFIEKLSLNEICLKLNKNMDYVKTTQRRAIKSLKELVINVY